MFFNTGTYWIYQDSTSGALDSVWVYSSSGGFDTLKEGNFYNPAGIYEWFQFRCKSNYENIVDLYYEVSMSFASPTTQPENPDKIPVFRFKDAFQTVCMTSKFVLGDKS